MRRWHRRIDVSQSYAVKYRQDWPAAAHVSPQDRVWLPTSTCDATFTKQLPTALLFYASCAAFDDRFRRPCTIRSLSLSSCHGSTAAMLCCGLTSLPIQPSAVSAQLCRAIHRQPTTLRQTTSAIITHALTGSPPLPVFNYWRPIFCCGRCTIMKQSARLPPDIVGVACDILSRFRRELKTFCFRQSYPSILF